MKPKIRQTLILATSLIFIALVISTTSSVSAEANITSIDYPLSVESGETIHVVVYFEYTDAHVYFLYGPTADLFYSINSQTIAIDDFYVSTPVVSGSRPNSLTFNLPTSTLKAGNIIRFEIRYTCLLQNIGIESYISDKYRIDIEQDPNKTNLSVIGISFALITLAVIFTKKMRSL